MKEHKTIHEAILAAQIEFPLVKKTDKNPFFKSTYAGLPSVLEVVMPILHTHGLFVMQHPTSEDNRVGVKTSIVHAASGEAISGEFTMTLAKNDPQGAGSAITYARRYALVSMLGLNVDEDDDANAASTPIAKKAVSKPTAHAETVMSVVDELGF